MAVSNGLRRVSFAFATLALCRFALAAEADDTTFVIKNTTGTDIVEVYATPSHHSDGPGQPLPKSAVPAGASVKFTIVNGNCAYELWFVFVDGHKFHTTMDFCDFDTYVVGP